MSTRSRIVGVVIGVIVGIAMIVFIRWMTMRVDSWFWWLGAILGALAILALIYHGCAEIFKIIWLGKAAPFETDQNKRPARRKQPPKAPSADSIKRRNDPLVDASARHDERIKQ